MPSVEPRLYVLCGSAATAKEWGLRANAYPDLAVIPVVSSCAIETIRELARDNLKPFLVCWEDVWIGAGMAAQVRLAVSELNAAWTNWALCSNRGVRWDGYLYNYCYDDTVG